MTHRKRQSKESSLSHLFPLSEFSFFSFGIENHRPARLVTMKVFVVVYKCHLRLIPGAANAQSIIIPAVCFDQTLVEKLTTVCGKGKRGKKRFCADIVLEVVKKFCENVNFLNICKNEASFSQYCVPPIDRSHEDTKTIITFQCC